MSVSALMFWFMSRQFMSRPRNIVLDLSGFCYHGAFPKARDWAFSIKLKIRHYFLNIFAACKDSVFINKIAYLGPPYSEHKIVDGHIKQ